MFASKRKHKVIGRTTILISSTNLKKGAKYQGELDGRITPPTEILNSIKRTLLNHNERAILRLKPSTVVTGKE